MTDKSRLDKIQMNLAILFFICVVYPTKNILYPITKMIYDNIYVIACWFLLWVTILIVGSPTEINKRLSEKIISDHITLDWIVYPIVTINGFEVTIFTAITVILSCLLLYKLFSIVSDAWKLIKMWSGHILLISLWGWFTLIGDQKNSMMCLKSPEEKRSLIYLYLFMLTCVVFVICAYALQDSMVHFMLSAMNTTPLSNITMQTTSNMTIIPMNVSEESLLGGLV